MRYLIEPKDRIYVKGYEFISFAKNMSNKYSQKRLYSAKKFITDAIKTSSKRAIQKSAEATVDSIGNEIADKVTSLLKKPSTKSHSTEVQNDDIEIPKEIYTSPEKIQQIIDELRLV